MGRFKLHFITTGPDLADSSARSELQKHIARSHAARATHAKARRQQTIRYQAQKASQRNRQEGTLDVQSHQQPSPVSVLAADWATLCTSYSRQLNPVERMLLNHYMIVIIPLFTCNAIDAEFYQRINTTWVPFSLAHRTLVNLLLLSSCRHLLHLYEAPEHKDTFLRLAYRFKLDILRSIREAISSEAPWFSDATIAATIMLAYDELSVEETTSSKYHVEGAVKMVALRGGPQTLGLDGLLERLLFTVRARIDETVAALIKSPYDPRIASFEIADGCHQSLQGNDTLAANTPIAA
ncbi:hypothetical protein BJY01DRAFT_136823 [Aspergillus pseudoustus]|uniref:Uncharacterized protein n=1 Tax=Aspergillus pseudoustus TaxID=1810923 RepID=A0ABR4KYR3_9EURO